MPRSPSLRRRSSLGRGLAALGLALFLAPAPSAAEDAWSADMADELMSPFCPGRTLRSCPSPQAGELIVWIEEQESEGRDREEVYEQLLSEFGEEIRQAPTADGFGATAYAVPLLAFVAGGAVLWFFLRRQGGAEAAPTAAPPPTAGRDPELERIVDEELRRST